MEKGAVPSRLLGHKLCGYIDFASRDVVLIDNDRQGSANYWAQSRNEAAIVPALLVLSELGKDCL
jgi:chromosome partitioning protein